ncbi:MAG TPA: BON domain-containing protein [Opitutaceae bacterium]|nr:BON domain-containing protein [Opitutaceae bacterium]
MKTKNLSVLLVLLASPIALFASSDTDRKIEDAAKASYNYQTVLEDNVKVKANDGVVTLTGTVFDKDQAALAVDTVENIPGVVSVKNEIKVDSKYPEKSDAWIAFKIRGTLLVKANVSATSTDVKVEGGNVLLTGTADSLAQKELTTEYAKGIEGVKAVKNEIIVKDQIAMVDDSKAAKADKARTGSSQSPTVGEKIDDASITTQVKFALLQHKSTSALKTKISTNDGVVRITGDAANEAEKSLVSKLASDVRGTQSMNNEMTVKPVKTVSN